MPSEESLDDLSDGIKLDQLEEDLADQMGILATYTHLPEIANIKWMYIHITFIYTVTHQNAHVDEVKHTSN